MQSVSLSCTLYQMAGILLLFVTTIIRQCHAGVVMSSISSTGRYYEGASANVSSLLDSLLHGYDKRLRPHYKALTGNPDRLTPDKTGSARGPPVEIGISMHVSAISSISEIDMDFTLDMYFRQHWRDARLSFQDSNEEELCISQEMLAKIWWPDTFFANAKEAKFHYATTKNAFLRINPRGEITQSLRLTVTAMCNMDLTFFPMDSQTCTLQIESYGYSTRDIHLVWETGDRASVYIQTDVQLPQFQIMGYNTIEKIANTSTGNYSRLAAEFYFERSLGYYIIQIYVPSCLIVVLSWVSFWLSREAVPARVALGITTVLTMTTLISSTNASLPKISYLKSIDIFLIFCFFMVFMSLMEYAAVSYMANWNKVQGVDKKKEEGEEYDDQVLVVPSPCINGETLVSRKQSEKLANYQCHPMQTEVRLHSPLLSRKQRGSEVKQTSDGGYIAVSQSRPRLSLDEERNNKSKNRYCTAFSEPGAVDTYSRLLFPLVFLVFNTMYWLIYLNISKPFAEGFELT